MSWIMQRIPWLPEEAPLNRRSLPGIGPLELSDWLLRDESFDAQMAERDRLLKSEAGLVTGEMPGSGDAIEELSGMVLGALDDGYSISGDNVRRPDGVVVPRREPADLTFLGRLVQEDFCLLGPDPEGGWMLSAAVLCFPAFWRLDEKLGRGLQGVHTPVPEYDENVGKRVSRLFDAIQPDRVLWRYNAHPHATTALFCPKREAERLVHPDPGPDVYLRSERQTLRRLPETGWVVFAIRTGLMPFMNLSDAQVAAF